MTNKDEFAFGHIIFENGKFAGGTGGGLTKREYFAAMAMQATISSPELIAACQAVATRRGITCTEAILDSSVQYAEALIEALNKEAK